MGIETTIDSAFAEAVRKVGSQTRFGRLIGKSQSSVNEALSKGKPLWADAVLKVEAATGISKHKLRPDLYPDESGHDPAADRRRPAPEPSFGAMEPTR